MSSNFFPLCVEGFLLRLTLHFANVITFKFAEVIIWSFGHVQYERSTIVTLSTSQKIQKKSTF